MVPTTKDIVSGRRLLITGGTGSFGNAFLHYLLTTDMTEVRIFSRDEKKQDDMRHKYSDSRISYYIGDVRNYHSILDAMSGVDFVFHAAALKQVPSCEFYPMEALLTNTVGADNVMNAAIASGTQKVIVLSTDKAVYPINAMGLSKGMMEKVMVAKSRVASNKGCILCGTRYGNVMASRGSVIPLIIQQIKDGLPLTVTDGGMTRFMMPLSAAILLVMFAFENGDPGDIFVHKAPAATINDVVAALKRIFKADNPVRVIGVRHGEKQYETLINREEMVRATDMDQFYRIRADNRDLNYERYFTQGETAISTVEDYHSHNTRRLNEDEVEAMLLDLDYVQEELKGWSR